MEVWVDPETRRIKAIYRGCSTTSRVWGDQGYKKYDKIEDWMLQMERPEPKLPARPLTTAEKILIKKGMLTEKEIREIEREHGYV